ncbi:hypothetical protein IEQ34_006712 [Dendrobium chrysotoxum]|uniref:Uncharacterized protein n=1 Tax=Dendrobium chrysotoxum TaxID=161865 RepID=A0AAV7H5Y8_DENCH|nr:hypothetical protein IEQ34_006712 [Dendrobium chrysotoxum]
MGKTEIEVLTVCNEEEDVTEEENATEEENNHKHLYIIEVYLNSVVGFTPNHTMNAKGKVKGKIRHQEVVVEVVALVDS